jgi:hypothetical protein
VTASDRPVTWANDIDAYLDQLARELRVEPGRVRRILTETEDHLRQSAAEAVAAGASEEEGARQAIARFGAPRTVARRFAAEEGRLLPPALLLHLTLSLGAVAGVLLVAVGVSGLLAAGMGAAFGKAFVSGDAPGVTYTAERCADYFEYFPNASDCADAATQHHFEEVVFYRLTAGVLGLLVLGGLFVVRRRYPRGAGVRLLPESFAPTVVATLFGIAALYLLGNSMQIAFGITDGTGALLSGGVVALAGLAIFALPLLRTLRRSAPAG